MSDVAGLIERLNEMAPEEGRTIRCNDRTTAMMNRDIREAATALQTLTDKVEALTKGLHAARNAIVVLGRQCPARDHAITAADALLTGHPAFEEQLAEIEQTMAALTKEGKSA